MTAAVVNVFIHTHTDRDTDKNIHFLENPSLDRIFICFTNVLLPDSLVPIEGVRRRRRRRRRHKKQRGDNRIFNIRNLARIRRRCTKEKESVCAPVFHSFLLQLFFNE